MTDNPLVEAVARSVETFASANYRDASYPWGKYQNRNAWHNAVATAALRAIEDAGWKVVKKEEG